MHKKLRPEDITAIIDTREKVPWQLSPILSTMGTLTTGDYSVKGLEHMIAIERKSLPDLLMCIGKERERFEKEIQRLLAYPSRAIIVESKWEYFVSGDWPVLGIRSLVNPSSAMGSVLGWIERGIPILFGGEAQDCAVLCSRLLYIAARRRFYELKCFYDQLKLAE